MSIRNARRLVAGLGVTVLAYLLLGAAGLWGVAFAAPALVFAPSAVRSVVRERKARRDLDVELDRILAGTSEHR
jgi:hypothetical protein